MEVLVAKSAGGRSGWYLSLQDEQSLAAYLSSPIIGQIKSLHQLREISAKRFETIPELTVVTRGPIPVPAELKGTNQIYEENVHVAQ